MAAGAKVLFLDHRELGHGKFTCSAVHKGQRCGGRMYLPRFKKGVDGFRRDHFSCTAGSRLGLTKLHGADARTVIASPELKCEACQHTTCMHHVEILRQLPPLVQDQRLPFDIVYAEGSEIAPDAFFARTFTKMAEDVVLETSSGLAAMITSLDTTLGHGYEVASMAYNLAYCDYIDTSGEGEELDGAADLPNIVKGHLTFGMGWRTQIDWPLDHPTLAKPSLCQESCWARNLEPSVVSAIKAKKRRKEKPTGGHIAGCEHQIIYDFIKRNGLKKK